MKKTEIMNHESHTVLPKQYCRYSGKNIAKRVSETTFINNLIVYCSNVWHIQLKKIQKKRNPFFPQTAKNQTDERELFYEWERIERNIANLHSACKCKCILWLISHDVLYIIYMNEPTKRRRKKYEKARY